MSLCDANTNFYTHSLVHCRIGAYLVHTMYLLVGYDLDLVFNILVFSKFKFALKKSREKLTHNPQLRTDEILPFKSVSPCEVNTLLTTF